MTRKHFIQLAENISKISDRAARRKEAEATATVCAAVNPRFDYRRFYLACGVPCTINGVPTTAACEPTMTTGEGV